MYIFGKKKEKKIISIILYDFSFYNKKISMNFVLRKEREKGKIVKIFFLYKECLMMLSKNK